MTLKSTAPPPAIDRALQILAQHPAVSRVAETTVDPSSRSTAVEVVIHVALPNAWAADGMSPNGVRVQEPVRFTFLEEYPLRAPIIELRPDFDRSLAHFLPGSASELPRPCIIDGLPSEFLQQRGLLGIVDQLSAWLENAALGRLINPEQGWEPARRDNLDSVIVADAAYLRGIVTAQAGRAVFEFDYSRIHFEDGKVGFYGLLKSDRIALNSKLVEEHFRETRPSTPKETTDGKSVGMFVWPGKLPSGDPVIAHTYQPETVTNIESLFERAKLYGCAEPLQEGLNWLQRCVSELKANVTYPIAIILAARRPFNLIGTDSPIEISPYIVEIGAPKLLRQEGATAVFAAGHRDNISPRLLQRLSGVSRREVNSPRWALIGAGSVGSKIGMHLARAGLGPTFVIDRSHLSPHNAARHALYSHSTSSHLYWTDKAKALVEAIKGFGHISEAYVEDIANVLVDRSKRQKALHKRALLTMNTTASLVAREALIGSDAKDIPRVVEVTMFGRAQLCTVTTEGPNRNPNCGDLIAELYALSRKVPAIRQPLFDQGSMTRQGVGEGCGSLTMTASDAQISMMAAPVAEISSEYLTDGLPTNVGRIDIGLVGENGRDLIWTRYEIEQADVVKIDNFDDWSVRIGARARKLIAADVSRYTEVETGGIVIGRISEASKTIFVVDVLPAPPDSVRTPSEFQLGTAGVLRMVEEYERDSGGALYCMGTWHSHLSVTGPSGKDRKTAKIIGAGRIMPSVLLIHTPAGFRAVLADGIS